MGTIAPARAITPNDLETLRKRVIQDGHVDRIDLPGLSERRRPVIAGGLVILDIQDMANPKLVSCFDYHPPYPGFTHTAVPLFDRGLLLVSLVECSILPLLPFLCNW